MCACVCEGDDLCIRIYAGVSVFEFIKNMSASVTVNALLSLCNRMSKNVSVFYIFEPLIYFLLHYTFLQGCYDDLEQGAAPFDHIWPHFHTKILIRAS